MKALFQIACWLVLAGIGFLEAQTTPSPDFSDVEDFLKDYAFYGQHHPAVEVMVQALKESPKCDDYDRIVAEIRG